MAKKKIAATPADKPPRLPGNRTTKGSRKPVVKPYEPSQNHLEWYKLWTEGHLRPSAIAERFNVSRQSVLGAIRRVADWMRLETFDDIIEIRYRQQAALEHVAALALQAFVQSAGEHTIVTVRKVTGDKSTETTKRTEHLAGNPAFLAQYCAAVAQISAEPVASPSFEYTERSTVHDVDATVVVIPPTTRMVISDPAT